MSENTNRFSLGSSILDASTLQDVTRSVGSLCISNVNVPRFDLFSDVLDFIAEFERLTAGFSDEQCLILLSKAFPINCHRAWFETELAPLIKQPKPWAFVKEIVIRRFGDTDSKDRHFKKIRELRYDPESGKGLLDFVEEMLYSYSKAYPGIEAQQSAVSYVKACLPMEVKFQLNFYGEFRAANNENTLKMIAKQYDQSRGYISKPGPSREMTREFTNALQEIVTSLKKEMSDTKQVCMAAIKQQNEQFSSSYSRPDRQNRGYQPKDEVQNNRPHSPRNDNWVDRRTPPPGSLYQYSYRGRSPQQNRVIPKGQPNSYPRYRSPSPRRGNYNYLRNQADSQPEEDLDSADVIGERNIDKIFDCDKYIAKFSKPPTACDCGCWHWRKHCPMNLN